MRRPIALLLAALAPGVAAAPALSAPGDAGSDLPRRFEKREAMIPMRDGVRLHTEVYLPRGAKAPPAVLLTRTPYGTSPDENGYSRILRRELVRVLLRDGYAFAIQDVRGRFGSEGTFVNEGFPRDRSDPASVDEGTDAFDTVAWLVAHVPGNGRVGILGSSYGGWLTVMAMLEPHPAVRAYAPQATWADLFLGDDDFHGGAFRLASMFDYVASMEGSKGFTEFAYDRADSFEWFLRLGALSNADARHFHGSRPTWNAWAAHPSYDAYWRRQAVPGFGLRAPAPTLHVGGWYDQEDLRGPVEVYRALEAAGPPGRNVLVVGPWSHSQWWGADPGDRIGAVRLGSDTLRFLREEVIAPFFACHLKDRCGAPLPGALVFQTGANRWQRLERWPPAGLAERSVWLAPGRRLALSPPGPDPGGAECESFVSDPASPVPYAPRPIEYPYGPSGATGTWRTWMVADQRFADRRPDVLSWETEPLAEDVVVAGPVTARLFVSSTGTDADFVAKLIDVHPETVPDDPALGGYQLMVAAEPLRLRFRRGFERPVPLVPGEVEEIAIDLLTRSHVFRKGHRIMVQVQSTWFPLFDRNPQTFVPNPFLARDADFAARTHRVCRSARYPSRVTFGTP